MLVDYVFLFAIPGTCAAGARFYLVFADVLRPREHIRLVFLEPERLACRLSAGRGNEENNTQMNNQKRT